MYQGVVFFTAQSRVACIVAFGAVPENGACVVHYRNHDNSYQVCGLYKTDARIETGGFFRSDCINYLIPPKTTTKHRYSNKLLTTVDDS